MALALPLLAGLALAPLFGGRLRRLGEVRLRSAGLFFAAIALQLAAFPVSALPWHTPDNVAVGLWLGSYALLALAAGRNLRLPGVPLVVIGMISNLSAILANGGHMPALPAALRAAGHHFLQSRNSIALSRPHLGWLVDRWAAPPWVPYANVFSVGDILIAVGGFVFAFAATGALKRLRLFGRSFPSLRATTGAPPVEAYADAIVRPDARIEETSIGRVAPAELDTTLERARDHVAALAATAADLEATLPARIGEAVRDGLREEVLPVGRHVAEVRGQLNQVIRRLEHVEISLLAERNAHADELSLLTELVTTSWRGIEERLKHIEAQLTDGASGVVYRIDRRQAS